jgi:hypothetical protein
VDLLLSPAATIGSVSLPGTRGAVNPTPSRRICLHSRAVYLASGGDRRIAAV